MATAAATPFKLCVDSENIDDLDQLVEIALSMGEPFALEIDRSDISFVELVAMWPTLQSSVQRFGPRLTAQASSVKLIGPLSAGVGSIEDLVEMLHDEGLGCEITVELR